MGKSIPCSRYSWTLWEPMAARTGNNQQRNNSAYLRVFVTTCERFRKTRQNMSIVKTILVAWGVFSPLATFAQTDMAAVVHKTDGKTIA